MKPFCNRWPFSIDWAHVHSRRSCASGCENAACAACRAARARRPAAIRRGCQKRNSKFSPCWWKVAATHTLRAGCIARRRPSTAMCPRFYASATFIPAHRRSRPRSGWVSAVPLEAARIDVQNELRQPAHIHLLIVIKREMTAFGAVEIAALLHVLGDFLHLRRFHRVVAGADR